MSLITLIYVSSAVKTLRHADILEILKRSREKNGQKAITGMLLFKDGNFMQVLEGDDIELEELHRKIKKDPRHTGVITLMRKPISQRSFNNWKMAFKDIGGLTQEEKNARSDYLDLPLNDASYITNPGTAMTLLESFKKSVR